MYKKGYEFERALKHKLESDGWVVIRSGGSKKPDLVCARNGKILVIECKATAADIIYLEKEEVRHLEKVAQAFGGECVYYVKKNNAGWRLVPITELVEAEKNFVLRLKD